MKKFLLILTLLFSITALADVPAFIPFSGYLEDKNNNTPMNGNFPVAFHLYDVGDNIIWSEMHNGFAIVDGEISLNLGDIEALDYSDVESAVFLEIVVNGESLDKIKLGSVPFAFHSDTSMVAHSVTDLLANQQEIENYAEDVCFDTVDELRAELDGVYKAASWLPDWSQVQNQPNIENIAKTACYDTPEEVFTVLPDELKDGDDSASTICQAGEILRGGGACVPLPIDTKLDQTTVENYAKGVCLPNSGGTVNGDVEITGELSTKSVSTGNLVAKENITAGTLTLTEMTFPNSCVWESKDDDTDSSSIKCSGSKKVLSGGCISMEKRAIIASYPVASGIAGIDSWKCEFSDAGSIVLKALCCEM